jgi:hypothetical protein
LPFMRWMALAVVSAAASLGLLAPPASAMPPPCPVHQLVGYNPQSGYFVWPPGCTTQPIYIPITVP